MSPVSSGLILFSHLVNSFLVEPVYINSGVNGQLVGRNLTAISEEGNITTEKMIPSTMAGDCLCLSAGVLNARTKPMS